MKFKLSSLAAQDLEAIYLYGFINFGETQADRYVEILHGHIGLICENPKMGRLDLRVMPAVRRVECESHVVVYDIHADHILVVRILHGAADFMRQMS